jgi:energy-converting hydrogenase Eha subunit A
VSVGAGRSDRRARRPPGYFSPILGPLAALAILEGYKLLGVIPANGSAVSVMASGRAGAAAFAVLVLAVAVTVTRAGRGRRRPWTHRLVVTGAAVVAATTGVSVVIHNSVTTRVLGLADLALAATVLAALMAGEWHKRHTDRSSRTAPHSSGRVPV